MFNFIRNYIDRLVDEKFNSYKQEFEKDVKEDFQHFMSCILSTTQSRLDYKYGKLFRHDNDHVNHEYYGQVKKIVDTSFSEQKKSLFDIFCDVQQRVTQEIKKGISNNSLTNMIVEEINKKQLK